MNRKIVECSSKVLAPRIVRRYALSKGSTKGPQGVRNAYCNRSGSCLFCLAVKVLALFSSEVLAPKGRIKLIRRGLVLLQCARGKGPNRPKVSYIVKGSACSQALKVEEKSGL